MNTPVAGEISFAPASAPRGSTIGVNGAVYYKSKNAAGTIVTIPVVHGRVEVECEYVGATWRNAGFVLTDTRGYYVLHMALTKYEYCRAVYLGSPILAVMYSVTKAIRAA